MLCRTGSGKISACGGNGFAGGGGGRISVNVASRHDDPIISAHGEIYLSQTLPVSVVTCRLMHLERRIFL